MSSARAARGALRVALGEYDTGWHDPERSLARAAALARDAAAAGAELLVLPEMCTTGFTMDADAHAAPLEGPQVRELGRIAAEAGVHLIAGVAARERTPDGARAVNAAVLLDSDGETVAVYRKQRLFAYAGEHLSYAAGAEPVVVPVGGVRLALFICYDLRFPELFRAVATDTDALVLIANWPASRRAHWDTLVRARAIENQCYVVAVNRTGVGGGLAYDGGSVVYDPWGELVAACPPPPGLLPGGVVVAELDVRRVREVRERFPFLRDRATPDLAARS